MTQTGQCRGRDANNTLIDGSDGVINNFGPSNVGSLDAGETVYDKCFNECAADPTCNAVQVRWPELYCVLYSMTVTETDTSAPDAGEYRCYLRIHSPMAPPTAASPRPNFPPMPPKPDGTLYDNYTAVIAEAMDVPITSTESDTEAGILTQADVIVSDRITVLIDAMAAADLNISSNSISGELVMVTSSTARRRSMRSRRLQTSGGTSIAGLDTSACNTSFADSAVFGVVLTITASSLAERDAILAFMITYDSSGSTTAGATGIVGETATVCAPALVTALRRDLVDAPPPPPPTPQADGLSIEAIIALSAGGALVLMCMAYTCYVLCKGGARPQQNGKKKKSARDRDAQEELRSLQTNAPVATSVSNYKRFRDPRGAHNSQRMRVVPATSQATGFTFSSIRGEAQL